MTTWIQDCLPGMEFPDELRINGRYQPVMRSVCPKCGTAGCLEDAEFAWGESCD